MPRTVPLRTDSIGNLFWGLSPLLPLKEGSVKRMKINLILLSRSGQREPQTRYWKTKTGFLTHDTFIFYISIALFSSFMVLFSLVICPSSLQTAHTAAATISPYHKVEHATEANSLINTKQRTEEKVLSLQEKGSDHVLIAGLRPKGFSCESVSQAARLGNNMSALNLSSHFTNNMFLLLYLF